MANCCVLAVLILTIYMQKQLPDRYSVVAGEEITFASAYPIRMVQREETQPSDLAGSSYQMDLKLLGTIPVKTVEVNVVDRKLVTVSGSGVKGTVNVSLDMSAGAQESRPSGLGKVVLAVYDQKDRMVSLSMWDVDLSDPDYLLIRTINIPTGVQVKAIRLMVMGGNLQPVMSAKGL